MKMTGDEKLNLLHACLQFVPVFYPANGGDTAAEKALAIYDAFKAKFEEDDDDWDDCDKPVVLSQLANGDDPLDT